jgi:hydroxymethylbilane synthase
MIRVATRRSPLALLQAEEVAARLRGLGAEVKVVPMRTEGDRRAAARLAEIGGKGLFVRELEQALLAGDADVAVHSLKDLPAELPDGLVLAVYPEREAPHDVLVTRRDATLDTLPEGAVVGTSSPRRRALLLAARPDLVVESLRGNVETRLHKLESARLDAVILAAAGLRRLGLVPSQAVALPIETVVPAVGQGVLAVQTRRDDERTLRWLESLDHAPTRAAAIAERAFLGRLGASCTTPIAGHARLDRACGDGPVLLITALVISEDGRRVVRASASGAPEHAEAIGREVAETLLEQGAASITPLLQEQSLR